MEIIASGDVEGVRRFQCNGETFFQARDLIEKMLGSHKWFSGLSKLYSEVGDGMVKGARGSWLIAEPHIPAFSSFILSPDNQNRAREIYFGSIRKMQRMATKMETPTELEMERPDSSATGNLGYTKERLPGIDWDFTFMVVGGRRFVLCADVEQYLTGRRGSKYYSGWSKLAFDDRTRGPGPAGMVCNYMALEKATVPFRKMRDVIGGPKLIALENCIATIQPSSGNTAVVADSALAKVEDAKKKGIQLLDTVARIEEAMRQMSERIETLTRTVDELRASNADLTEKLASQSEAANSAIEKLATQALETSRAVEQLARPSHQPARRSLFSILRAA